jgi:purine-binding chemotaxis protein CheW
MNASVDAGHIMGVGCVKHGDVELLSILADIESLMSSADMGLMEAMH